MTNILNLFSDLFRFPYRSNALPVHGDYNSIGRQYGAVYMHNLPNKKATARDEEDDHWR